MAEEEVGPDAAQSTTSPTYTYAGDIAPLFQDHCLACHREGGPGPFSLETYDDVAPRAESIKYSVGSRRMPHGMSMRLETGCAEVDTFHGPRRLTQDEIDMIVTWANEGAPEGDPNDVPPPREFPDGEWVMGEPDLEIVNAEDGFDVPGGLGRDIFRRFVIPTDLDGDTFITGFEAIPGVDEGEGLAHVVHHVTLFIDAEGRAAEQEQEFQDSDPEVPGPGFEGEFDFPAKLLGMWFPGSAPLELPDGLGIRLPQGATIVMEVHYATYSEPVTDRTRVGLHLADTVEGELIMGLVKNEDFVVPAGESGYEVEAELDIEEATRLYAITPHMHQIGTDFKVMVDRPGESTSCLADVAWDFEHQGSYWLQRPMDLPAGSTIRTSCYYDNTEANPHQINDPPEDVVFGRDADLEMCQLTIGIVKSAPPEPPEEGDPLLAEVLYDAEGGDDGKEWVKLENPTEYPIDLSGYALGWGGVDYTYGTAQLGGTIPAGECFVIGAVPPGALGLGADFDPDIQNGGSVADGLALFEGEADDIGPDSVPIDVVIYGGEENGSALIDETGEPAEVDVVESAPGQSIRRVDGEWIAGEPAPTSCP